MVVWIEGWVVCECEDFVVLCVEYDDVVGYCVVFDYGCFELVEGELLDVVVDC